MIFLEYDLSENISPFQPFYWSCSTLHPNIQTPSPPLTYQPTLWWLPQIPWSSLLFLQSSYNTVPPKSMCHDHTWLINAISSMKCKHNQSKTPEGERRAESKCALLTHSFPNTFFMEFSKPPSMLLSVPIQEKISSESSLDWASILKEKKTHHTNAQTVPTRN